MQQVAVGAVNFDHVEADARCALRRLDEGGLDAVQPPPVEGLGQVPPRGHGQRRGRHGLPGAVGLRQGFAAAPDQVRGGLAPGMGQLDADARRAIGAAERHDPGKRGLVRVRIEPHAARGDAPLGLHAGGLDDHQSGPGYGELAQMHDVPVADRALAGAVLAHGRDDDAVGQLQRAQTERREECRAHDFPNSCLGRVMVILDRAAPGPVAARGRAGFILLLSRRFGTPGRTRTSTSLRTTDFLSHLCRVYQFRHRGTRLSFVYVVPARSPSRPATES